MKKRNYKTGIIGALFVFSGSLDECIELLNYYVNHDLEKLLQKAEGI